MCPGALDPPRRHEVDTQWLVEPYVKEKNIVWKMMKPRTGPRWLAVVAAMAVGALVLVGLASGTAAAAPLAVSHEQQLETARAYAEAANPGASVVFAGAQVVKPGAVDQWDFVFMVDGTTRYGVSLKSNGSLGWKSTVPNCLFPVPCESLPVESWVSSPSEAIAAIASTDARFAGGVSSVVYGKNPEVTEYHGNPTYYVTSTMVGYTDVHTWRFDPVRQRVGLPF